MTHKILCAIDGTDHGKVAVETAADLARMTGAKLEIAMVNAMVGGVRGPSILAHDETEVDKVVSDAASVAKKKGAKDVSATVLKARDVAMALVRYADENGVDHIVTGTGGKGSITRFVLGSVASDVVNRAHCPVTVAR
jgi:nucleotide-binding universal stress UspA family protein